MDESSELPKDSSNVVTGDVRSQVAVLLSFARWIGGALGIATVLGAIGWYIEAAQNDLFGIRSEISNNYVSAYLLNCAQFVIDCLRVVLDWHLRTIIVALILGTLTVLAGTRLRQRLQDSTSRHPVGAPLILLLLIASWTTYFAVPTFLFRNTLFLGNTGTGRVFDVGWLPGRIAEQTWKEVVCSHKSLAQGCNLQSGANATDYGARLESRFACALMLLAFLWAASLYLMGNRGKMRPVVKFLRAFVLVGLVAATTLVPYIYGKLVLPTTFPLSTITFTQGTAELELAGKPDYGNNFAILRDYSDKLILYNGQSGGIWPVPKAHIALLQIGAQQDILAGIFK